MTLRMLACSMAVALTVGLAGCNSEPPSGTVSGSIKLDGTLLASGSVTFTSPDGKRTSGGIKDGQYKVDRIPPGSCKVSVMWVPPASDDPMKKVDAKPVAIPAKYSETKSNVTVDVRVGANPNFDIAMTK